MFQRILSCSLQGLQGRIAEVECCLSPGLPYFHIVGLPPNTARECRERIRSALRSSGYSMPAQRITINIRPAITHGALSYLDFPIAIGILSCQALLPAAALEGMMLAGELSLDGRLQPISAALSFAHCAAAHSCRSLLLPASSAPLAASVSSIQAIGLSSLSEAVEYLRGHLQPSAPAPEHSLSPESLPASPSESFSEETAAVDLADIHGQETAKRAAMIAAAGFHNLLLIGPPGIGKTMLAQSLPGLLPPLRPEESLELTQIYALQGTAADPHRISVRPFRAPHPSIPTASLLGGGSFPLPGEITLAHHGILFLDELSEYSREALEGLRMPLEEHAVCLRRLSGSAVYPADFLFVGGMNPCPCGYFPDRSRCHCTEGAIRRYLQKISGPLLDRLDLIYFMNAPQPGAMSSQKPLSTKEALLRLEPARKRQRDRFAGSTTLYNSHMTSAEIKEFCCLGTKEQAFLQSASSRLPMNPRSLKKVLTLSRTLADLDDSDTIECRHLAEALQYRGLDLF